MCVGRLHESLVGVLGLLVILLAFAAVCFVKSKRSAGASNAGMQTRGAFDNPAYGAPQGKANPMYGAEGTYGNAGGGGTYDNAQFSGGGNTGGYMDVQGKAPPATNDGFGSDDEDNHTPEEHSIECACELLMSTGHTLESVASGRMSLQLVCGRLTELRGQKKIGRAHV